MQLSRRKFLKAIALLVACAPTSGCEPFISQASNYMGLKMPDRIRISDSTDIDPVFHLLSRAAYGPWPGDVEKVSRQGISAWIEEQLHPNRIDDRICRLRSRRFESLLLPPGECYEFKEEVLRRDLVRHAVLRALYTKRQLNEVMVEFWTDHLNINIGKGDCIYLKPFDDRNVIRKHALGSFEDLIRASATSPAMLVYLDGAQNKRASEKDVPNENYARELLELHTLGVDGGYTQRDVYETARCLTGWTVEKQSQRGQATFDVTLHDQGEKLVLGKRIPAGGGSDDLEQVITIVAEHPSTASFIARKLCVRFIADEPPDSIVKTASETFRATKGSIRATVKSILTSEEFAAAKGTKIKRPFQFIVGSLRMLGADTHAHDPLVDYLLRMGQGPFQYPTPDGYPDESTPWLGALLWRWNFAFDVCSGQLPSVELSTQSLANAIRDGGTDRNDPAPIYQYMIGRKPHDKELAALKSFVNTHSLAQEINQAALFGLVMSSPAFLRC